MPATVDSVIANWPEEPRESAKRLIEQYGPPQEYEKPAYTQGFQFDRSNGDTRDPDEPA